MEQLLAEGLSFEVLILIGHVSLTFGITNAKLSANLFT